MKLYKILIKQGELYYSPFEHYCYGKLEDFIGKILSLDNFDMSDIECSNGFYATPISGLIYTGLSNNNCKVVFETEMSGKNKKFSDYKWRWENQTFIKELSIEEVKLLVKEESNKMDWNYYEMMFPKNPLLIKQKVTDKHKQLLRSWALIWNSVQDSVFDSVEKSLGYSIWSSVRDSVSLVPGVVRVSVQGSVGYSVWNLVQDSIMASVGAYISSGFPNIKNWKYIDHEEGINPFQSGIDLWNDNLIPSFDGNIWRVHSGAKAEIVFEISKEDLMNL